MLKRSPPPRARLLNTVHFPLLVVCSLGSLTSTAGVRCATCFTPNSPSIGDT